VSDTFKAVRITDRIYWVGAIDWSVRDFHGYLTQRGTTYNAFLVLAEKITLIDTVKAPFMEEMMMRIASVIDPSKIDLIISNHAEMDHSGSLPATIERVRPEKVYASTMGVKALARHFHQLKGVEAVKDGQSLDLGGDLSVTFMETRMLHWPDSMFSFIPEEGVLFAQDGFGMHLASHERFADELPRDILQFEAEKYYANILMLYAPQTERLFRKVSEAGLSFPIIAPDHGPIWRGDDVDWILGKYSEWTQRKGSDRALVVYETMWGSTDLMARAIGEGISSTGAKVSLMPLKGNHRSDIMTHLLTAGALVLGSPTLNNNVFPAIMDLMTYVRGLKPKNLIGAAFGSYGWSGEAPNQLSAIFDEMKIEQIGSPLRIQYVPSTEDLALCRNFGETIGKALLERHSSS
jgi:flavorubredoxin